MDDMINNRIPVPSWMTQGRTVLCQKDHSKGNAVDNYRPISCLPLMWKLLTGVIAESMYEYLERNNILPEEQKGCRRKSRGTEDQLLIDKVILQDCKKGHKNLAMAWVDYRKAYDLVPHSWILECLELSQISENIKKFIENTMKHWATELTSCGENLEKVDIRRGIFQGDSLSPLLFVICMVPLTKVLRKIRAVYVIKEGNLKVNHLLFMDDLKLFGKNEREIDSLVKTVQTTIKTEETVRPEEFKRMQINASEQAWKEKRMHGQYIRDMDENIDKDKTWGWLKNGDLKAGTEALICAAQDQALRTNYVKHHIDKTLESPLCRLCGEKGETINHIVSECKMLAQREYKRRIPRYCGISTSSAITKLKQEDRTLWW